MKKKVRVHMLATKDSSHLVKNTNNRLTITIQNLPFDNEIGCYPQHLYLTSDEKIEEDDYYVHTGVSPNTGKYETLNQCHKGQWEQDGVLFVDGMFAKNCRKIVATTDKSLKINSIEYLSIELPVSKDEIDFDMGFDNTTFLPQIPKSFIQEYVEAGGKIEEVKIEYNNGCDTCNGNRKICLQRENEPFQNLVKEECNSFYKIKTDSNNCVIISKSKNDVVTNDIKDLVKYINTMKYFGTNVESVGFSDAKNTILKWIKENL